MVVDFQGIHIYVPGNSAIVPFLGMVSSRDPFKGESWPPTIGDQKVTAWITGYISYWDPGSPPGHHFLVRLGTSRVCNDKPPSSFTHFPPPPHNPGLHLPPHKKLPNPTDLKPPQPQPITSQNCLQPNLPTVTVTLPKTNTSHLLGTLPKRKPDRLPTHFRGRKNVGFRLGYLPTYLQPSEQPTTHLNLLQPPTQPTQPLYLPPKGQDNSPSSTPATPPRQ